jgi:hypothetical protein
MPSRYASCALTGSPPGGEAEHRLGLAEDGVVGRDDEVGALASSQPPP